MAVPMIEHGQDREGRQQKRVGRTVDDAAPEYRYEMANAAAPSEIIVSVRMIAVQPPPSCSVVPLNMSARPW